MIPPIYPRRETLYGEFPFRIIDLNNNVTLVADLVLFFLLALDHEFFDDSVERRPGVGFSAEACCGQN